MDRSSNRVVAAALALTLTAGVVYSGPAQGSTAVAPMPRSALGADLGFSAHLHDPTSGLILARALVLDPLTGSFLQRDPNGYQDSVNQYAYGANDPINHRDPTGLLTVSKEFAKASPTATRLIKRLLDRLRSSPWWKDILFAYGRYGGASEREVVSALTWGQGPMLDSARTEAEELDPHDPSIVNVITACGSYDYENRPGVLKIDPERLAAFESGQLSEEALLGTILHELTHYFDHRRPEKDRLISEVGHSFEAWVFGRQACDPPPRPPRRKADAGRPLEIPADPFRFPRGPVQFPIPPMP